MIEISKQRKNRRHKGIVGAVCLLLISGMGFSQQPISLQQAFDQVATRSYDMAASGLQRQYLAALGSTAGEMPRTKIMAEMGQTNSANFDTRFSALQSFLPFGYAAAQRDVLNSNVNVFDKEVILRKAELRLLVRSIFHEYRYQQERANRLKQIDSLFGQLLQLAQQRLQAGETNRLESATYRQQQLFVQQQLLAAEQAMHRNSLQLKILLRTDTLLVPVIDFEPVYQAFEIKDSMAIASHPLLLLKHELIKSAAFETALHKAARHPELELGYNNQSLIGYQTMRDGTEKFYDAGNRFSTAQVGINFPLFGKASKAKVKVAEMKQQMLSTEAQLTTTKLAGEWEMRVQEQQMLWKQLTEYRDKLLPEAQLIESTATQQLKAGELGFLNWLLLVEPALQSRLQYLDKVQAYKSATIQLLYMTEVIN